jgi:glycosyltransferase involved in cell wall biosynthesis
LHPRLAALRRLAIIPAYNEAEVIASVIDEIRNVDSEFEVVVVDDGSTDGTAQIAEQAGARTVRQYARDRGFQLAIQVDGDGQHDPNEFARLVEPILEGRADMVVGSRFIRKRLYQGSLKRRLGIQLFARAVSIIVGQRITDPTSGFRAVNRRAICLFAGDYPHDYPEVEATVLLFRHRLTMVEVPVRMRLRTSGRSSITALRSIYYMVKVSLALFISLFRRYPTPLEER